MSALSLDFPVAITQRISVQVFPFIPTKTNRKRHGVDFPVSAFFTLLLFAFVYGFSFNEHENKMQYNTIRHSIAYNIKNKPLARQLRFICLFEVGT